MRLGKNRQGLGEAQKTRNRSKTLRAFNKAWHVGDKISVFFPIFWNPEMELQTDAYGNEIEAPVMVQEIDTYGKPVYNEDGTPKLTEKGHWDVVVASVWGHKNNAMKELKLPSFIPSLTDIEDGRPVRYLRDEKGEILYDEDGECRFEYIEGDVTYQFSMIAPVFIHGRKKAKLDRIANKPYSSPDLMRAALQAVEDEFDTNKSMDAPRPAIGKCMLYVSTEVVVVPVGANDAYLTDKANMFTYDFGSSDKIDAILNLLRDVKFRPRDLKQTWFEVQFTFNGTSDDQAGRAAAARKAVPVGLTPEYTMQHRNPEAYAAIRRNLADLPTDSSIITHRNFSYRKKEEAVIRRALEAYAVNHSEDLDQATEDADKETMLRNASRLMTFSVLPAMRNQELKDAITESYEKWKAEHAAVATPLATAQPGYSEPTMDHRPTAQELVSGSVEADLIAMEDDASLDEGVGMDVL